MTLPSTVRRLPLDDLSGLVELIGDAHVVAIGENNHHIREFTRLRARILRLLVTELGFGVLAFESGFAEGQLVDEWIRGGPVDLETVARDGFTFRSGETVEMHEMLGWLRAHNAAEGRVRFAGLDVPGSGGSGLPALHRVRDYLAAQAPDEVPLCDAAVEATRPYIAANNGAAPARYAEMGAAQRDAATAALTRLLLRMDALWPGADRPAHAVARHHALGALRLDEQLRELSELTALAAQAPPDQPVRVCSSRDVYHAETVRLLRELYGPDERIVLMMHNGHIQRSPMELLPGIRMRSAGSILADDLGADYVAVGVTALAGSTTDVRLDENVRSGFEVLERPLPPPADGSVEQAVERAGGAPVLLDLRPVRGTTGLTSIRHATMHVPVDVPTAFDALACLPTMHPGRGIVTAAPESHSG